MMKNLIFIHGLESSGQGFKGQLLREVLPGILTPDFKAYVPNIPYKLLLNERMNQLGLILEKKKPWIIIGSSFGGLMGTLYTFKFPKKVSCLILLAPLLKFSKLDPKKIQPIDTRVIIFHGKDDKVISLKNTHSKATKLFRNLTFNIVDDDHMLHSTVSKINWPQLIKEL